jgi:uncharacterized protein YjiS (DUF1127 family)
VPKHLGWPASQCNPFDRACAWRGCFALSTNHARWPSARQKETIMLDQLRRHFARWRAYRQTLASLRHVSDSTLADAGISRQEIRKRARQASLRL